MMMMMMSERAHLSAHTVNTSSPQVPQSGATGTFLLSEGALLSPVSESDLFCPMVPCCGDMVSIKTV